MSHWEQSFMPLLMNNAREKRLRKGTEQPQKPPNAEEILTNKRYLYKYPQMPCMTMHVQELIVCIIKVKIVKYNLIGKYS